MSAAGTVTASELKSMLRDGAELALVDVREQGVYYRGHLLFASCIPISRLETMVGDLIPRRAARIVLCDDGDAPLARQAAARLARFGYRDVSVLTGGVRAWKEAGYEVFSGVNVPSKAFGEYVEHRYDTPRIAAGELAAKCAAGERLVILDSRPMEEFRNMSIPGGIDCPGAELVYRAFDAAADPQTLVVVNCAGRTRSIIGAQSLINAGIPNRVVALKDGTMGWQLAGFEVSTGRTEHAAAPGPAGLARAQAAAAEVAQRFGVKAIDRAQLGQFGKEAEARTLYVFDVRTPEEYAAGHLPGSRHAPGGQLVQATDEFAATRHARIVLVDDTAVRATMTASWLRQLGWKEVFVLQDGLAGPLEQGMFKPELLDFVAMPTISATDLESRLEAAADTAVLDFASSLQYRKRHIPGAYWCMRTRLEQAIAAVRGREWVVTSPDSVLAHYCAREISSRQEISSRGADLSVRVLEGGTDGWFAAGLPEESGAQRLTCEPDDVWYKPYEQRAPRQAMQDYLTWEVNLVEQIARDGDARFR
jgi:rhodanese-related sulfurtransferase